MSEVPQHAAHEPDGLKPKPVVIFVNNREVTLRDDHATGIEIKAAANVPASFQLFDAKGREVDDNKRIRVHKGDRFTAISGQDVS
jgi:hypothetical protein